MCHHVIVIYHFNIQFYRYILVDISWVYFLTSIIIFIYGEGNTEYLFIFYFYFFVISSTFDRERKSVRLLLFWRIWIVGKLLNLKHVAIARNAKLSLNRSFLRKNELKSYTVVWSRQCAILALSLILWRKMESLQEILDIDLFIIAHPFLHDIIPAKSTFFFINFN